MKMQTDPVGEEQLEKIGEKVDEEKELAKE